MKRQDFHIPVLKEEAISFLKVQQGKKYIDATIGGGGHGLEIVKRGGIVLGIDVDREAIKYVEAEARKLKLEVGKDLILVNGNFKDIEEIARLNGFTKVAGIIFDLGVSSWQLSSAGRGFSFQTNEPLDMRMDSTAVSGQVVTAADLVNALTKKELYELFNKLGQEKYSWAISDSIIRTRKISPIRTTGELAELVTNVYNSARINKQNLFCEYRKYNAMKKTKIHPATKVFQALRIAVNDELNNLRKALPQALELLDAGARLVVISFHSLEDKIVKNFGKENEVVNLTKKPIVPAVTEIIDNPRARSAKMRVFEKP